MKRFSLPIGVLLLSLTGCLKPATRSGVKETAAPGEADAKPFGSDVTNALTPDAYLPNLSCDVPGTFRGLRAWRRLSNIEVQNTAADVFGVKDADVSGFPGDLPKKEIFDTVNVESNFMSSSRWGGYETFAVSLASKVDLNRFFPCIAEGASCLTKQLPDLLSLAWRRPATQIEVDGLSNLYNTVIKDGSMPVQAVRVVIQAIVLSQNFLYRSELGVRQNDNSYGLTDWEMASAFSYIIWRRPPNEELRKIVLAGGFSQATNLRPIVEKMFNDPLAKEGWKDFAAQWLETGKIETATKKAMEYNAAVKKSLIDEARNFFTDTMFSASSKTYKQLLTADYSVAEPALDFIYEAKSIAGKTPFIHPERRGLLGLAGFLSSHALPDNSNPILRGVFINDKILCNDFAPAPPFTPPESKPGLSNRELFRQHNNPVCASCHTAIDNVGFAFENFDGLGKFRTTDAGDAITVDGKLTLDGRSVTVASPREMSEAIGNSLDGQRCYVRTLFRYSLGRTELFPRPLIGSNEPPVTKLTAKATLDRCQIEYAAKQMNSAAGDLRTGVIELLSSNGFRYRLKGELDK